MTRHDVIIIGGGINGLVAGAVLARRGRSVYILEQRADLGGMATLTQDGGPSLAHLLYNLNPRALQDAGLDPGGPAFAAPSLPAVSLCPEGRHVVLHGHSAETPDGRAHPDAAAVRRLLTRLTGYGNLLRSLAEAPPPGGGPLMSAATLRQLPRLASLGWGAKRLGKPGIRRFLQDLLSNAHDLILDEIADGPLAGLLAADAVRGAAAGPRSPGTVFNLIYRMGHGGTAVAPAGGMAAVIAAVAAAARDAGCQIETGQTVTQITLDGDQVVGVSLADGTTRTARKVMVGSGPQVALALTGAAPHDIETTRRIRSMRTRGTVAKINIRLDSPLAVPGLPDDLARARLVVAPSITYVETAFNPAKYGDMSANPVIEAVQMTLGDRHWLSCLVQYAPSDLQGGWTDTARERLRTTTFATLDPVLPDLARKAQDTQVITPDLIAAATSAPGGHWHHAEMALDQLLTLRPVAGLARYQMGPKGLYLCGASSHPGGDVMGLAGRNAALAMLEDAK